MSRHDRIPSNGKSTSSVSPAGRPDPLLGSLSAASRSPTGALLGSALTIALLLAAVSLLAHDSKRQSEASMLAVATSTAATGGTPIETASSSVAVEASAALVAAPSSATPAESQAVVAGSVPTSQKQQPAQMEGGAAPPASSSRMTALNGTPEPPASTAAPIRRSTSSAALPMSISANAALSSGSGVSGAIVPNASAVLPLALAVRSLAVTLAAHPRLILDPAMLTTLRQRAAANTPEWKLLKASCDSFIGGTVEYPTGTAYPNLPNAGSGYQGEEYLPALLNEAICYQVLKSSNPAAAAPYGAKAVDILMKMSTPYSASSGNQGWDPCTDSGYGIRNYGVGFGLGYDWIYELLTPAQRTQVFTTANAWLTAWEAPGGCAAFAYKNPQGNYFAGYFHAKAVISLATYDENPSAPAQWNNWLNTQFAQRVQPYYAQHLAGGGWPEGYANYAPPAILNMSLPAREVKTAIGQDLVHAAAPYTYPLTSADYAMHFTWPSRAYFDDRDTNHSTGDASSVPGTTPGTMFVQILGELSFWNSSKVGVFQQYLNEVRAATSDYWRAAPWLLFLDTDPAAPTAALSTLPLSYFAQGMNAVAARSDWGTGASWMSFRAGPYVNNPDVGEEYFDQGSLALVRGGSPLLLNASGWLMHEPGGNADETKVYNDNYGAFNGTVYLGNRQLYNVFYVRNMSGSTVVQGYGQNPNTIEGDQVRTRVSAWENGADYVYVLATHLEDMYRVFSAGPAVSAWSREIVYLRPNRFVVYDRTVKGSAGYDQFMAWHFPANPVAAGTTAGQNRLDVTYQGNYVGAMTTVLPANATTATLPLYPGDNPVKAWQVQVRPPDATVSQTWLTVFDLSSTAANVATASPVTVNQGSITGVQLLANDGNSVVIGSTGAAGAALTGTISYRVAPVAAYHVITELAASTGYTVTATPNGNMRDISVSVGGTSMSSATGVLSFHVTTAGVVQPTPPPAAVSPISTVPVSTMPVPGSPRPYQP